MGNGSRFALGKAGSLHKNLPLLPNQERNCGYADHVWRNRLECSIDQLGTDVSGPQEAWSRYNVDRLSGSIPWFRCSLLRDRSLRALPCLVWPLPARSTRQGSRKETAAVRLMRRNAAAVFLLFLVFLSCCLLYGRIIIEGDGLTYYALARSLVEDGDFELRN